MPATQLRALQAEYEGWRDQLPESLAETRTRRGLSVDEGGTSAVAVPNCGACGGVAHCLALLRVITIRAMTASRTLFVLRISCVPVTVLVASAAPALAQVTAADVVDKPTLQAFVERAHAHAEASLADVTEEKAYEFFDREFRPEGEWRQGPIYTGVILAEGPDRGTSFFHAVAQELETQNLWDLQDKNGVYIIRELIAKAGTGFVEYYYDNPDVIGDEDEGSLKVAWAEVLIIAGRKFTIGSGFYPATAVPVAPPLAQLVLAVFLAVGGSACLCRRQRR